MNRWVQGILLFDFELVHVPASEFKGPDALSRREATQEEIKEAEEDDIWLDDIALYFTTPELPPLSHITYTPSVPSTFIIDDTKQDHMLQDIKTFLEDETIPQFNNDQAKKRFLQKIPQFFVQNGHLYKRRKDQGPLRVILTAQERMNILIQAHEGLAHRGIYGVF